MEESNMKSNREDKDNPDLDSQVSSLTGGKSTTSKNVNNKEMENSKQDANEQITQTTDMDSKTGKTPTTYTCDQDITSGEQYFLADSLPARDRCHLAGRDLDKSFSTQSGARPKIPRGVTSVSGQSKRKPKIPSERTLTSITSDNIHENGSNTIITNEQSPLVATIVESAEISNQVPLAKTIPERSEDSNQSSRSATIDDKPKSLTPKWFRQMEYGLNTLQRFCGTCTSDEQVSNYIGNFCGGVKEVFINHSREKTDSNYIPTKDLPEKFVGAVYSSMIKSFVDVDKESRKSTETDKGSADAKTCEFTQETLQGSNGSLQLNSCKPNERHGKQGKARYESVEQKTLEGQSEDSLLTSIFAEDIGMNIDFDNLQYLSTMEITRNLIRHVSKLMTLDCFLECIQTMFSGIPNSKFKTSPKELVLIPSGSVSDCCMTSRWFQSLPYLEVEIDFMYSLGTFPMDAVVLEPYNDEHSCYVNIHKCKEFNNCFIKKIPHAEQEICEDQLLDPTKFRQNALLYTSLAANENYTLRSFRKGFAKDANTLGINGMPLLSQMGPDETVGDVASTSHSRSTRGGIPLDVFIDNVPCIKLSFWPNEGKEWLDRNLGWPCLEDRKYLTRFGCHIVPKSPRNVEDSLWRISFSAVEKELVSMFSHQQKCIFYLFRVLYYKYIKSIGQVYKDTHFENKSDLDSVFSSYHIKTAMFWICEEHGPTSSIWDEENTLSCLAACVGKMQTSFQDRILPHFFVRKENLLAGISTETLDLASRKLNDMKQCVLLYIPYNISEIQQLSTRIDVRSEIFIDVMLTFSYCTATRPSVCNSEIELD